MQEDPNLNRNGPSELIVDRRVNNLPLPAGAQEGYNHAPNMGSEFYLVEGEESNEASCIKSPEWNICGLMIITREELLSWIVMVIAWLLIVFVATPVNSNRIVPDANFNPAVVKMLYPCAVIFIIYGLIFMKIPMKQNLILTILTAFSAVPFLVLCLQIYSFAGNWKKVSADVVTVCCFLIFTSLYWFFLRLIRDKCDRSCGSRIWGLCSVVTCCYFTFMVLMALIYYKLCYYDSVSYRKNSYQAVRAMISIIVLIVWSVVQYFWLYRPYEKMREKQIKIENQETASKKRRATTTKRRSGVFFNPTQLQFMLMSNKELVPNAAPRNCKENMSFYGGIVGNVVLGICFTVTELILIDELDSNVARKQWEKSVVELFISLLILSVIVIFLPLTASELKYENKQLIIFGVVMFIPFTIVAIVKKFNTIKYASKLLELLLVILPIFAFYIGTLSYIRRKGDNIYRAYLTISGLGLLLPLVLSYALYFIGANDITSPLTIAGIVLFLVSGLIVFVYVVVQLVMKIMQLATEEWEFEDLNFKDIGHLMNMSGGIVGVFILMYSYANCPDTTLFKRSLALAMTFLIVIITVLVNIALRLKVPIGITSHSLNYMFSDTEDPNQEKFQKEKTLQKMAFIVGMVGLPVIFFVLFYCVPDTMSSVIFMSLLIGVFFASLYFIGLLEIRKKIGIYVKNFLPLCTTCVWIFAILPLIAGIPAVILLLSDQKANLEQMSGLVISFVSILIMVGVTIAAIIVNYVFKQMDIEKKAKFCVKLMENELTKIAVRSDEDLLRLFFDQYLLNGEEELAKALIKGNLANWWPIPDRDSDVKHNRQLVDAEQHKKLKKVVETTKIKVNDIVIETKEDKKEEIKKLAEKKSRMCCSWCYDSDDEDKEDKEDKNQLIEKPIEDQVIKAKDTVVDFRELMKKIRSEQGVEDQYVANLYVQPYSAFEKDEEEEIFKGISYLDYLDIIESRNVNSEKFLEVINSQEECYRKFFDQVFEAFADQKNMMRSLLYWVQSDFVDFCTKSEIKQSQAAIHANLDYDTIFVTITSKENNKLRMNRKMFGDALKEIAFMIFPDRNFPEAQESLMNEIIYPGLYKSMPNLITVQFAKNVMSEKFKVKNLYPEGDEEEQVEEVKKENENENEEEKKDKHSTCRKCCISLNKGMTQALEFAAACFGAVARCFGGIFGVFRVENRKEEEKEEEDEDENANANGNGNGDKPQLTKQYTISPARARRKLRSYDWPEIVERLIKSIRSSIEKYDKLNIEQDHNIAMNSVNIVAILSEIYGAYVLASMAFDDEVGWGFTSVTAVVMSAFKMSSSNNKEAPPEQFTSTFWVSFALCFIYIVAAIPAASRARKGTLGLKEDGNAASMFSCDFILDQVITVIGSSLYVSIVKNLLLVFSCRYDQIPWTTYVKSDIKCWEGAHYAYLTAALIGVIVYYPMATFMFPNLQFKNKLLDLKFYPSFIIMLSQVKLFMSGLQTFYANNIGVVLSFTACAFLALGLICLKMQPCLVKNANLWYATEYFLISWLSAGGAIMKFTQMKLFSMLFIILGASLILISTYLISRCFYNTNGLFICFDCCCAPKAPIKSEKTPYDSNKEDNDNDNLNFAKHKGEATPTGVDSSPARANNGPSESESNKDSDSDSDSKSPGGSMLATKPAEVFPKNSLTEDKQKDGGSILEKQKEVSVAVMTPGDGDAADKVKQSTSLEKAGDNKQGSIAQEAKPSAQ